MVAFLLGETRITRRQRQQEPMHLQREQMRQRRVPMRQKRGQRQVRVRVQQQARGQRVREPLPSYRKQPGQRQQ
jgi:hypothetical protein